jgi:hypothetical protein
VTIHAGYLVDLQQGIQFDDESSGTWLHAMGLGKFHHPMHGEIELTPERIKRFADNFANRVRGIDIAIDYDHRAHGGDAAGWVRQAEARSDGLWLFVEWTQTAYKKLKEKAYRYFSPEFLDEWEHPETRIKFKDVLFGGGITNRPFLKNLVPVNMTEMFGDPNSSGGTSMDPAEVLKQLAKLFGLPEDSDPAVTLGFIQAKVGEVPTDKPKEGDQNNSPNGQTDTNQQSNDQQQQGGPPQRVAATEDSSNTNGVTLDEEALMKLPFVKTLMETVTNQGKKLDEDAIDKSLIQLSEKAAEKKVAIPPVIKDGLRKQLAELPPSARPGLIALTESMLEAGSFGVALGENGHSGGQTSKSAQVAIETAVTKKMSESGGKLTYADAVDDVARENPQLYLDYQRELANS